MDKYEEQARRLTERPYEIQADWSCSNGMFQMAYRGNFSSAPGDCGCLTMIRMPNREWAAQTPELTAAIRADERIPDDPKKITPAHFPVFIEWQRRLDRELLVKES